MEFVDNKQKKGSPKNLKVHFELPYDEPYPALTCRNSTSSSSSDSSDSSLGSPVEVKDEEPPVEVKQSGTDSQGSSSSPEVSPPFSQWSMQSASPSQSPNIFLPSGYDPSRIPSSIFAKPSSAMEWSVASNESLFSIHLGNNSFSRDHFILMNKSGELNRPLDEVMNINPPTLPPIPQVKAVESEYLNLDQKDVGVKEEEPVEISEVVNTSFKDSQPQNSIDKVPPVEALPNLVSASCRSDDSIRSFQFPLLAGDAGRNSYGKVELEKKTEKQEVPKIEEQRKQQEQPLVPATTEKAAPTGWSKLICCCWGTQGQVSNP